MSPAIRAEQVTVRVADEIADGNSTAGRALKGI
jgi:hypothetical protein